MTKLKFAPSEAHITLSLDFVENLLQERTTPPIQTWADQTAEKLDTLPCGLIFSIGKLRLPIAESRQIAQQIAQQICAALKRRGAPDDLYVEIDKPQATSVKTGHQARTLLPHHDGGHCTYLTPSQHDVPSWPATKRQFSDETYTTTKAHKLYQGIFMADPGECLSVTTYFDLLQILADAYQHITNSPTCTVTEVAAWLGDNIQVSFENQAKHQSRYLTLGAMLGAKDLVHMGMAVHYAEAKFTNEELARFPELQQFQDNDTEWQSPTERYLDTMFVATLGITWAEFQHKYQLCAPTQFYDLVLGHNLSLWHGGLLGGPGRLIEPICFVLDKPAGEAYETWLAQAWRSRNIYYEG